jgi:hypothetical protein
MDDEIDRTARLCRALEEAPQLRAISSTLTSSFPLGCEDCFIEETLEELNRFVKTEGFFPKKVLIFREKQFLVMALRK